MEAPRRVVVLFGTQSGTAEEVAESIAMQLAQRGVPEVLIGAADDLGSPERWPQYSPIIFVCATAGHGGMPHSVQRAWDVLRMTDAPPLHGLRYAVFGLGDSSYKKYNYAAKMLHNRLTQLGAAPLLNRGLGDDQDRRGYEDALAPWLTSLWNSLGLPIAVTTPHVPAKWHVEVREDTNRVAAPPAALLIASRIPFRVTENERITATDHFQDVRHIELVPSTLAVSYNPGDSLAVFPQNSEASVKALCRHLALPFDGNTLVRVSVAGGSPIRDVSQREFVGKWWSVQELFQRWLDISRIGTRALLALLARHTPPGEVADRLTELSAADHFDEFLAYCVRERRTVVEVLADFPTAAPSIDDLVSVIGSIRPRLYTICSSPAVDKATIALTVGVLVRQTPYRQTRFGLCSEYLATRRVGDVVEGAVSAGRLQLPTSPATPLILITPGTGIALARSVIRHCVTAHQWAAPVLLFSGCRHRGKDDLYHAEFELAVGDSAGSRCPLEVLTAFSRDQPTKQYVQHLILSPTVSPRIADLLLEQSASVFICGSARQMPVDVEAALILVLQQRMGCATPQEAAQKYSQLVRDGNIQVEAWA